MLEAEVDEDFFTPVTGATLATIFGNPSKSNEGTENDTLKYTPTKPDKAVNNSSKPSDTKTTKCLLADVVSAHEWFEHQYKSRGTLGIAILLYLQSGHCKIILYGSDKTTVSHATISRTLELTVKNNTHISYYDDERKYWSVNAKEDKVHEITDLLIELGANVKNCSDNDNVSTVSDKDATTIHKINVELPQNQDQVKDIESDTDSSVNRKTKAAIIQRMAHMGHSVLPCKSVSVDKTSDSSDTNDAESQTKAVRHKSGKLYKKCYDTEAIAVQSDSKNSTESVQIITPQTGYGHNNSSPSQFGQLMPLTNSSLISTSNNELGLFMSEQRISNSELRININRITDKVDSVLEKINKLNSEDTHKNIETNILMKLLAEYESKIKFYEESFKTNSIKNTEDSKPSISIELEGLKNKISELEKDNYARSCEVVRLNNEITRIKYECDQKQVCNEKLLEQNHSLSSEIQSNNEELAKLKKKDNISDSNKCDNTNIADKIKAIVNELFQTISANFEDDETYSGASVKKITGTVIKRNTIRSLQDL